ncbi:MAG: hypothetical protein EXR84_05055 [Gammaproteobacteria bacterium]|nr:hypothetical protein [Gammaproteobacteria bacterium]
MSKPEILKTQTLAANKTPGRAIGFTVMSLLIFFAGFWMQRESTSITDAGVLNQAPLAASNYAGFNANQWYLPDDELLGLVEIPAGAFTMGSNPALDGMAYENERWSSSQHQGAVDLPGYFIGRYEVTVDQFNAYLRATATTTESDTSAQPGNFPISNITWAEALAYGRWLEQQLRESSATPQPIREQLRVGAHVTLPSEAEWEKAARGTDARIFPWGSEPTFQFANFGGAAMAPVGSKSCPSCAHGLADMSGNVWELTRSPLQDYPYDAADDLANLAADPIYAMRGGSYAESSNNVRAAIRGGVDPGVRSPTIGFRVVLSVL